MERIKQAMERARAERQSRALITPSGEATRVRFIEGRGRKTATDARVDYTRTAIVPTDPRQLRERRVILSDDADEQGPVASAYRVLRTHILQRMRANGWKTLGVTSPTAQDGKTLTAINLAISLAREVNQTILLVDMDLKRPSIGRYFVDGPMPGIGDYLVNETDIADLLIHPGIERLVVLPGNDALTLPSELLSSPRAAQLVAELKGRYDDRLILFDLPPLFAGDEVLAFQPYLDALLLVVEEGKVSKEDLQRATQLLGDRNILGMVLNNRGRG